MDVKVHVFTNISNSSRAEHNRMTSKATYLKRRGLNRLKYPWRVTVCPWHEGKASSEESTGPKMGPKIEPRGPFGTLKNHL